MGLDMYLSKKTYVKQWSHQRPEEQFEVIVKKGGVTYPNINPSKVSYVEEEVMYWRKFNALHQWFVENVQGGTDECQTSYVSREKIVELVETLKRVRDNKDLGGELLPTQEGFFFGGTDYDEYYYESVNNTLEVLEKELEDETADDFSYHASW